MGMKCLTYRCENHEREGGGMTLLLMPDARPATKVWICMPCYAMLVRPDRTCRHTQIVRNAVEVIEEIVHADLAGQMARMIAGEE